MLQAKFVMRLLAYASRGLVLWPRVLAVGKITNQLRSRPRAAARRALSGMHITVAVKHVARGTVLIPASKRGAIRLSITVLIRQNLAMAVVAFSLLLPVI